MAEPQAVWDAAQRLGTRAHAWAAERTGAPLALLIATCILAVALASALAHRRRTLAPPVPAAPGARARGTRTLVLLGSEQAGKTSVFLRMALGVTPETATSQQVNTAALEAGRFGPAALRLVDVPGHARLRAHAWEWLDEADALVFCIDASVASRGGSESATAAAALSTMKRTDLQEALTESVDYLHETLATLAARRLAPGARPRAPPALYLLFTRADRSPLFPERALLRDEKRRAQLLARCRRGVAAALMARRTSRGLHATSSAADAQGRVTIEALGEVPAADAPRTLAAARAWLARLPGLAWLAVRETRTAAELHPTRLGHNVRAGAGHQVSNERALDYLAAASRTAASDPLTSLDARVVAQGHASLGLASLAPAGWAPAPAATADLDDLAAWLQAW
ncbi:Uncharacterized protein MSYG_3619 [Malassezia sympodialis ATCC 42132]|uniref:Signal recognition particle receptor subunit beta n=1 Tax=Malassezia sympodialis (strain ATCC 42132) TaxID=1230383 RepID=A0A1M8AA21_MALS4|nr:Uncharacterized protein MSYG_3619 [Malassezia sympodialis ATCC 42132]